MNKSTASLKPHIMIKMANQALTLIESTLNQFLREKKQNLPLNINQIFSGKMISTILILINFNYIINDNEICIFYDV